MRGILVWIVKCLLPIFIIVGFTLMTERLKVSTILGIHMYAELASYLSYVKGYMLVYGMKNKTDILGGYMPACWAWSCIYGI